MTKVELLEVLSTDTIAKMRSELVVAQAQSPRSAKRVRMEDEILVLEKALLLKQAQITLIGNL